jgi:hypothetical protein
MLVSIPPHSSPTTSARNAAHRMTNSIAITGRFIFALSPIPTCRFNLEMDFLGRPYGTACPC